MEAAAATAVATASTAVANAALAEAQEARRIADELARQPRVINNVTNVTNNIPNIGTLFGQLEQWRQNLTEWDNDPLAQTFKIQGDTFAASSGGFITSVDLYFQQKDATIPITVELRNVVNGYPGPKV